MPLSDFWQPEHAEAQEVQSVAESAASLSDLSPDTDADEDNNRLRDDLARLKRQQRTAKARTCSLLSRQRRKLQRNEGMKLTDAEDMVAGFQQAYFASKASMRTWWNPFEETSEHSKQKTDQKRRRAVWLYFTNFTDAVKRLFLGDRAVDEHADGHQAATDIQSVLSVNVVDDTNIKLADGMHGSAVVRSVMSNVQQHIVFRSTETEPAELPQSFAVHQPLVSLKRANAQHLCQQLLSWCLCFAGNVGQRLQSWGVPEDLFKNVRRQVFILVSDALRTNDAVFQELAKEVHYTSIDRGRAARADQHLAIQVHCTIHQAALTRKTLALGFSGYWTTLVRFGHCFESYNFRQRFRAAMSKVVKESFQYVPVCSLPPEAALWKSEKIRCLRLEADDGHAGRTSSGFSKRFRAIFKHMEKDNGDARSTAIVHWCIGPSCCPKGKDDALSFLLQSFAEMFAYMSVPLLYRWKHAAEANNFIRDGFFWHRILARTLQAMPDTSGHFAIMDGS